MQSQGSLSHKQQSTSQYGFDTGENADAVVTIAADPEEFWVIDRIDVSYGEAGTLAGGRITVEIGGVTYLDVDIVDLGWRDFDYSNSPIYNPAYTKNEALVVTLYAGGVNVVGKVNVRYR